MARWHIASLLTSLGHAELAKPLVELTRHRFKNKVAHAQAQARAVLSELTPMMVDGDAAPEQPVIGGYVGRAGLLSSGPIDESEIAVLRKLSLRPTFVGVELDAIKRAIEGITPRGATDGKTETLRDGEDGAGSWVIRLDADERRVAPLARRT